MFGLGFVRKSYDQVLQTYTSLWTIEEVMELPDALPDTESQGKRKNTEEGKQGEEDNVFDTSDGRVLFSRRTDEFLSSEPRLTRCWGRSVSLVICENRRRRAFDSHSRLDSLRIGS